MLPFAFSSCFSDEGRGFPHHQLEMHHKGSLCTIHASTELVLGTGTGCHSRAGLSPPSPWLGMLLRDKPWPGKSHLWQLWAESAPTGDSVGCHWSSESISSINAGSGGTHILQGWGCGSAPGFFFPFLSPAGGSLEGKDCLLFFAEHWGRRWRWK